MTLRKTIQILAAATAGIAFSGTALAEEQAAPPAIDISFAYTADAIAVVKGGSDHKLRYLDNIDVVADADLDRLVGWHGATLHLYALNNLGLRPNDAAGTLQGIDNIEVPKARLKLYEAWLEQSLGEHAGLLVGLYDLNSEFYATDSSGLLIGAAFGIGSELAATGVNGPSIFPSTALTVRLGVRIGENGYVRAAALNAHAGTLGDDGGVKTGFHDGLLLIGEAGYTRKGKLAVGAWRYTDRQDDILATAAPAQHIAQGAYLLAEYPLFEKEGGATVTAFFRGGISDGRTGIFNGSWQTGVLAQGIWKGRPDSMVSFGVAGGALSGGFRQSQRDVGISPPANEIQFELTCSDRLAPFLVVQPDIQLITNPGGDNAAADVVAAGMRVTFEF